MKFKDARLKQVAIVRVCRKDIERSGTYREIWIKKITETLAEVFCIVHVKDRTVTRVNSLSDESTITPTVVVTVDPDFEIAILGRDIVYYNNDLTKKLSIKRWYFTFVGVDKYTVIWDSYDNARKRFTDKFGTAILLGQYDSPEDAGVFENNLKEI